jgi:MSHA biogenesis protein MshN
MSLINQMLQDLDARAGRPGAVPMPSDVKPVAPAGRGLPWKRAAIAAGAVVTVAAAGLVGWRVLGHKPDPAAVAVPAAAPVAPVVAFEVPVPPRQDPAAAAAAADAEFAASKDEAPMAGDAPEPVPKAEQPAAPAPPKNPVRHAAASPARPAATEPAPPARGGREETAVQRADNAYRRALASLEEGRVTEAIAGLRAALRINPRHEASRQTLVSLLMEARRPEEAIRELGASLAVDPRQPAMAMLMARLQLERGSPGINTLLRTLPHAAGNADYHAFLAGALQREQRHRESIEHYETALRTAPQNGVWWMGLGISLQAEQRKPEAAGAFQKALDSGTLSTELQGFVERKLKQLGP